MAFEEREKQIHDEIHNIKYTIDELQKLKDEKKEMRSQNYYSLFVFPVDSDYKINYFKRDLAQTSLTNEINEIDKMISLQKKALDKHLEYLTNDREKNTLDLVNAVGADSVY